MRTVEGIFAPLLFILACSTALGMEPVLHCAWTSPNTGRRLELDFADNPLVVVRPGEGVTLSTSSGGIPGHVTVFKDAAPVQTGAAILLNAPAQPGSYYIRLLLEAAGTRREAELCILVPHKGVGRRVSKGVELMVDGESVGVYRASESSGNHKVRGNPDSYQPPVWWLRVTDMNAGFSVVPGLKVSELVAPSEDTGKPHTDLVPICYPMWQAIHTLRREIETRGIPGSALKLISMFRTPPYNRGVGSNAFGRHVYGDAFDFYIDLEGDGKATDLNRDGKRDRRDAYAVVAIIEDLQDEGRLPMGGIGVYNTVGGDHEVTMHLDMRGHRATWVYVYSASGKRSEASWASRRFAELDRHEENLAAERAAREGRKYQRPHREPLP